MTRRTPNGIIRQCFGRSTLRRQLFERRVQGSKGRNGSRGFQSVTRPTMKRQASPAHLFGGGNIPRAFHGKTLVEVDNKMQCNRERIVCNISNAKTTKVTERLSLLSWCRCFFEKTHAHIGFGFSSAYCTHIMSTFPIFRIRTRSHDSRETRSKREMTQPGGCVQPRKSKAHVWTCDVVHMLGIWYYRGRTEGKRTRWMNGWTVAWGKIISPLFRSVTFIIFSCIQKERQEQSS